MNIQRIEALYSSPFKGEVGRGWVSWRIVNTIPTQPSP